MKRVGIVVAVLAALIAGVALGIAKPYVVRPELVLGQDAAVPHGVARNGAVQARIDDEGGRVIVVEPDGEPVALLVVYPGGLVRPQAYEWLGHALAQRGVRTVIPEFPFDLAVLDSDRAERLIEIYGEDLPVALAGHSLGGAMAASFVAEHPEQVDALVLMAAYPPEDTSLSDFPKPALVLQAEHDQIASAADVEAGLERMPPNHTVVVIEGAVHSFFGRYGPQEGDGQPTVTRATAEAQIAEELGSFVTQVG